MSFSRKKIDVTVTLGTGDFGATPGGPSDTVNMTGLKCSVQITKGGAPSADYATIRVWGVTRDILNKVTDLGKPLGRARNNVVTVSVGDDAPGSIMSLVYSGTIQSAYGDFSDVPNVSLNIISQSNLFEAQQPVKPLSFPAGADVVTVMTQAAASIGKNLINWGVKGIQLSSPYYAGTAIDQIKAIAEAAGINQYTTTGKPLEIWPIGGVRGDQIPDVGPDSGLVGYPQYCDVGVIIKTLYQPGFNIGGMFNLTTSINNAKGLWYVYALDYDLESETPGGEWFVHLTANRNTAAG